MGRVEKEGDEQGDVGGGEVEKQGGWEGEEKR